MSLVGIVVSQWTSKAQSIPLWVHSLLYQVREQRKIKLAYQFFLSTLLGSVFMLLAILLILLQTRTIDLQISLTTEFSEWCQIFQLIASFTSFLVKVPIVPVHIWLSEAHVKTSTTSCMILAEILLRLGTHIFLRFSMPMFPKANTLCHYFLLYSKHNRYNILLF